MQPADRTLLEYYTSELSVIWDVGTSLDGINSLSSDPSKGDIR